MGMGPMNPNMGPGMASRGFPGGGGMQQPYGGSMTNMPGTFLGRKKKVKRVILVFCEPVDKR